MTTSGFFCELFCSAIYANLAYFDKNCGTKLGWDDDLLDETGDRLFLYE
jgi:hypothetical protein